MSKDPETAEILALPAAARLQLMEQIWASLAARPDTVPVPDWHRDELDRRMARHAAGGEPVRAWDDVKRRLQPPRRKRAN